MTTVRTPRTRQMKGMILFIAALVLLVVFLRIIGLITDWFWFSGSGLSADLHRDPPGEDQDRLSLWRGFLPHLLRQSPDRSAPFAGTHFSAIRRDRSAFPLRQMEPGALKILVSAGSLLFGLFAAANGSGSVGKLSPASSTRPPSASPTRCSRRISATYVFQLPFLLHIYGWLKFVLMVTAAATGFIYLIRRSFLFIPPRVWKIAPAAPCASRPPCRPVLFLGRLRDLA